MVRLLLLMWCHVVLLAMARGEVIERAYYFGPHNLDYWRFEPEGERDPFAVDAPAVERLQILPMKEAPFESRFFLDGDELWDLTADLRKLTSPEKQVAAAIYNQSTGRVVLRGNKDAHAHLKLLMRAAERGIPRMVQLSAKIYRVPRKSFGITMWNGLALMKDHLSLAEMELMARPGQKVNAEWEDGAVAMEFEPHVGLENEWIDLRLQVKGEIQGRSFDLKTGATLCRGFPGIVELGAIGGNDVLVLCLMSEIVYAGGIKWSESIVDANGQSPDPHAHLFRRHREERVRKEDPKTGRIFQSFHVPPTILQFLDTGADVENPDPFATDNPDYSMRPKFLSSMKTWNPKVIARPGDRVIDIKRILEIQGVQFSDGDFACLVEDSSIVYAELRPKQMDLLEAIFDAG